jgi:hypothetical protein
MFEKEAEASSISKVTKSGACQVDRQEHPQAEDVQLGWKGIQGLRRSFCPKLF